MSRIDRDEPSIGSADMSEVEFRRPRPRKGRPEEEHRFAGLWWRIALGVFVGMMAHSFVVGLFVRWELQQLMRQWEAEAAAVQRQLEQVLRGISPKPATPPTPRANPSRTRPASTHPLAADERCVSGKRFRKVENGWVQVLEPCR